jgi:ATP-binding cassette, subfamily F, member 3
LDVETLESLEDALLAYPGAVIIVTHDRRFADSVANRVWTLEGGELLERSSWNAKDLLDPAFEHPEDEPIVTNPILNLKQQRDQLEKHLLELNYLLLERRYTHPLSGREEGRLQAERHQIQLALYQNYAQVYAAPPYTLEVRQKPLWVRGSWLEQAEVRAGEGATFWAKKAPDCPTLHWDGTRLEFSSITGMSWFRKALLLGALQILFERWDVAQVRVRGVTVTLELYLRLSNLNSGSEKLPKPRG